MYQSYQDVCVNHHSNIYNETFLSHNMRSLAFNYATSHGKKTIITNLNNYQTMVSNTCLDKTKSTQKYMNQITNNLQQTLQANKVLVHPLVTSVSDLCILLGYSQ